MNKKKITDKMIKQWNGWWTDEFIDHWNKFQDDMGHALLTGDYSKFEDDKDDTNVLKFAYISRNGIKELAWVDNKTMEAFEVGESYGKTNNKIESFEFIRWCTSFDL